MASQGHPPIDAFHMIKHDPTCLEVTPMLHPLHQSYPLTFMCMDILKGRFFLQTID
jgi:hypothetical protein